MQLAAWLDVALEGGVTELERALFDYRSLRRLLEGNWRLQALRVEELGAHVRTHWVDVERAIERARRRARSDEAAKPGLELAERVERARRELEAALSSVCSRTTAPLAQLDWLCDAAEEVAHYERSMLTFRMERVAWSVALLGVFPSIPFSAWWVASKGGTLGTIFSPDGLAEPQSLLLMLALSVLLGISTFRLSHHGWLGVPTPILLSPLLASGLFAMSGASLLISFSVLNPGPFLMTMGLGLAFGIGATLFGWWRQHDTRAPDMDVGDVRPSPLPLSPLAQREGDAEGGT